jgi:putative transposase
MQRKPTSTCNLLRDYNKKVYGLKKTDVVKDFCKSVKKKLYPYMGFGLHATAFYRNEDFLDTLTYTSMNDDFTENGSNTLRYLKPSISPQADTILYHIKKLNVVEIQAMFDRVNTKVFKEARKQRAFFGKIDVAIDITDILYYGDVNTKCIVRTNPKQRTDKAYRFATISIVLDGKRFTLLALPMNAFTTKEKVVKELILYAKKWIKIGTVYVDRGFFSASIMNLFEELGVKYLMPAVKNVRIKEIMKEAKAPSIVSYIMGDVRYSPATFKLVTIEDEKGKVCFATNLNVNRSNAFSLAERYKRRWGIETSYRVTNQFRPKTTSKNYIVRVFYYMFSSALYNLWILANMLIAFVLKETTEKIVLTAKMFGTVLYTTEERWGMAKSSFTFFDELDY